MSLIFKSKLYRDEFKHWVLIFALTLWALIASVLAVRVESKTILIGIDEAGSRLITDSNDRILQNELKNFIKTFIETFYGYDERSFSSQMGHAADLMSVELWETQKPKLLEMKEKLTKLPLSQSPEIESLDLIDGNRVEGVLELIIKSRISEQKIKLKVNLSFDKAERTETNPWGYEITEVSDVVL